MLNCNKEEGESMDILLGILAIIFALGYLLEKATGFIEKLKTSGSAKLSRGFKAEVSVVPIDKKSEVCATNTNPNENDLD